MDAGGAAIYEENVNLDIFLVLVNAEHGGFVARPTGGYVKLHRKILNSWVMDDPIAFTMLCLLVMWANREPGIALLHRQSVTLGRGQVATGRDELAKKLRCSKNKIDRLISRCEKDCILGSKRSNQGSIITILNYDKYQVESDSDWAAERAAERAADGSATRAATGAHKETRRHRDLENKPPKPPKGANAGFVEKSEKTMSRLAMALIAKAKAASGTPLLEDDEKLRHHLGSCADVFFARFGTGIAFASWYARRQNQGSPDGVIDAQLRETFVGFMLDAQEFRRRRKNEELAQQPEGTTPLFPDADADDEA
jgi:hypothetical protein